MLRKHSGVPCAAAVGVQGSRSNMKELNGKLFSGDAGLNRSCDTRCESVRGDNAMGAGSYEKASFALLP